MESPFALNGDRVRLAVRAVPGSSKNQICGTKEGRLKIKIAAGAEGGRANEEICSFLSKVLGCAKKDILIAAGEKSRLKTVELPLCVLEKLDGLI